MGNNSSSDDSSQEIARKTNETVEAQKRKMDRICQENLEATRLKEELALQEIAHQAEVTQVVGTIADRILTEYEIQSDLRLAQQRIISDAKIEIAKVEGDYERNMARIPTDLKMFQTRRFSEYEREKNAKTAELMSHLHKSQLECCIAEHEIKVLEEESELLKKKLEHKRKLKAQKTDAMDQNDQVSR